MPYFALLLILSANLGAPYLLQATETDCVSNTEKIARLQQLHAQALAQRPLITTNVTISQGAQELSNTSSPEYKAWLGEVRRFEPHNGNYAISLGLGQSHFHKQLGLMDYAQILDLRTFGLARQYRESLFADSMLLPPSHWQLTAMSLSPSPAKRLLYFADLLATRAKVTGQKGPVFYFFLDEMDLRSFLVDVGRGETNYERLGSVTEKELFILLSNPRLLARTQFVTQGTKLVKREELEVIFGRSFLQSHFPHYVSSYQDPSENVAP